MASICERRQYPSSAAISASSARRGVAKPRCWKHWLDTPAWPMAWRYASVPRIAGYGARNGFIAAVACRMPARMHHRLRISCGLSTMPMSCSIHSAPTNRRCLSRMRWLMSPQRGIRRQHDSTDTHTGALQYQNRVPVRGENIRSYGWNPRSPIGYNESYRCRQRGPGRAHRGHIGMSGAVRFVRTSVFSRRNLLKITTVRGYLGTGLKEQHQSRGF